MKNKLLAALGAAALSFFPVLPVSAGTEVIQDYGGRDVAPPYGYAPPPPRPLYYAPPPIGVAVYPRFGYYHRPLGIYRFHRPYWRHRRWR